MYSRDHEKDKKNKIIYSKKDIIAWRQALDLLPNKIADAKLELVELKKAWQASMEDPKSCRLDQLSLAQAALHLTQSKIEPLHLPVEIEESEKIEQNLSSQLAQLVSKLNILEFKLDPAKIRVNELKRLAVIVRLTEEIEEKQQSLRVLCEGRADAQVEIASLETELAIRETQNESAKSKLQSLESGLRSLHLDSENLSRQNLQQQLQKKQSEITSSRINLEKHQRLQAECNAQLNRFKRRISSARDKQARYDSSILNDQVRLGYCERELSSYETSEKDDARLISKENLHQELNEQNDILKKLESEFQAISLDKKRLEKDRIAIKNQIQASKSNLKKNKLFLAQMRTGKKLENLNTLKKQPLHSLSQKEQQQQLFLDAKKIALKAVAQKQREINAMQRQFKEHKANVFLNALEHDSSSLVLNQFINVSEQLLKFDRDYLFQESGNERLFIFNLQKKSDYLQLAFNEQSEGNVSDKEKYFILIGMLVDAENYIASFQSNRLSSTMQSIMLSCYIDPEEALHAYCDFREAHAEGLAGDSLADLIAHEEVQYLDSLKILENNLKLIDRTSFPALSKVYSLGCDLIEGLESKRLSAAKDSKINYPAKYYTQLLIVANRLLLEPNSVHVHTLYRDLLEQHPQETPSLGYKISGIALMFLGAVITAGAAIVSMLGLPVAAPLCVSVPVGVAGLGMLAAGIGLFRHGTAPSLDQKINSFEEGFLLQHKKLSSQVEESVALLEARPYGTV